VPFLQLSRSATYRRSGRLRFPQSYAVASEANTAAVRQAYPGPGLLRELISLTPRLVLNPRRPWAEESWAADPCDRGELVIRRARHPALLAFSSALCSPALGQELYALVGAHRFDQEFNAQSILRLIRPTQGAGLPPVAKNSP